MCTSLAVRYLIALRFGVSLGLSTVPALPAALGHDAAKPLARARERQPAAIAAWLEQVLPGDRQARQFRLLFDLLGDECGILNQVQIGRTSSPRPEAGLHSPAKPISPEPVTAVSNHGLIRFLLYVGV